MSFPLFHVDAFTDRAFGGNPAAVCLLDRSADAKWMQNVAAEVNLSETAFIEPMKDGFGLRWFTPAVEVDLCGHATLASAHVLWSERRLDPDKPAVFHTRSGALTCTRDRDDWITMDFPARPAEACDAPRGLLDALAVSAEYVGSNGMDFLVQVQDEAAIRAMTPDFASLKKVKGTRGIIVTAKSANSEFDFVSRFFAPAAGVDEDPVTGSAHCCLAPFWAQRSGRMELTGYQASKRGGVIRTRLVRDRVHLIGKAITISSGTLHATVH